MKKLFIIIIILFNGCSSSFDKKEVKNNFISNEMTFEEFKLKLEQYVKNSPYPNPDN